MREYNREYIQEIHADIYVMASVVERKVAIQAIVCVNCHVRMPTVFRNHSFDIVCGAIYTFDSLAGGCTRMFSTLFFPPSFSPRHHFPPAVGSIIRTADVSFQMPLCSSIV